jgi:SAM-dependent methyltransferase
VQQAFALDSARRLLSTVLNPKILAVGSYEDTTVEALRKLGFRIEEVDPNVNGRTLLDYYVEFAAAHGTYDLALCVSVLEHVEEDVQFTRMIGEFLKPGGIAILTVDFAENWRPNAPKPAVDHRLYTTRRICETLLPALGNCRLIDAPRWAEGAEDFEYEGCHYGFATLVFQKLDPLSVQLAAVAPVWNTIVSQPGGGRSGCNDRRSNDKMTSFRRLDRLQKWFNFAI